MSKLSLALVALALVSCGDKTQPAGSSAASASSATASSAAEEPSASGADIDKTVLDNLKKVSTCQWKNGDGFDGDCDPLKAFRDFSEHYATSGEVIDVAKQRRFARSCLQLVADQDPKIRWMVAECVSMEAQPVGDKPSLEALLAQLDADKDDAVVHNLANAVNALQPGKANAMARVIQSIDKIRDDERRSSAVSTLLSAISDGYDEPPPEVVTLALDLARNKDKHVRETAFHVLEQSKARAADACKVFGDNVRAKKWGWTYAAQSLVKLGEVCKGEFDDVVAVAVEKLGQEDKGGDTGVGLADLTYLGRFVDSPAVSKEQKEKIGAAADALSSRSKDPGVKKYAKQLAEASKK